MFQTTYDEITQRTALLVGDDAMSALRSSRIIVFGVGGVGSWCAESLVRTGIGHLTIVDGDDVCVSNINRQLMATTQTVGQPKVQALRERLLAINPYADIVARYERYSVDTQHNFNLDSYDCVVDAIDSLDDKMMLIINATRSRARLVSSMGAAQKFDPTSIAVAEFWNVKGCPLARALRNRFKRLGTRPSRRFQCVYSDEQSAPRLPGQPCGSLMHITATFGLTLAALVIQRIVDDTAYIDK